jgi:ABC-type nitrate/sulfonate/bicarbonate transport systems, periplasmic components
MVADSKCAPVVMIATYDLPPTLRFVVVSSSSKIYNLSQLNGTTAAVSTPGSVDTVYTEYLAKAFNLNIKIEYVGSVQAQIAAVLTGRATFTNIAEFDDLKLIDNHELRIVYNLTLPWPNLVVVTTRSFALNHPNAVKAALMGIFAIDKMLIIKYIITLVKYYSNIMTPLDVSLLLKTISFSINGEINVTQLNLELNAFKSVGVITNSSFNVTQMISNEFVKIVT